MQKISFGNKEYVKAADIAKQFRYTQDYVGQLCRSKKVDARLVGRVWFVEPSSVTAYRKTKHSTQKRAPHVTHLTNKTPHRTRTPKPVTPVVRSKTIKATPVLDTRGHDAVAVSYSADTNWNIPIVKKSAPANPTKSRQQPILPTAKKIRIKKLSAKKTTFKTDKLPEISLSGKIVVKESTFETETQAARQSDLKASSALQLDQSLPAVESQTESKTPIGAKSLTDNDSNRLLFAPRQVERQGGQAQPSKKPSKIGRSFSTTYLTIGMILIVIIAALLAVTLSLQGDVYPGMSTKWSLIIDATHLQFDFVGR